MFLKILLMFLAWIAQQLHASATPNDFATMSWAQAAVHVISSAGAKSRANI